MLPRAARQIGRHADVDRAVPPARHHIDRGAHYRSFVIASPATQSRVAHSDALDRFAALAMTGSQRNIVMLLPRILEALAA
ncbi:hypothetical protein WR25_17784 [Diploscapter pachys]|uniref:Uncharacterized protein n=1 Tax=Diploscapter pachys TaxID=2018661 RepID=A0A2A2M3M1_9BILA|nr:hypothetical protein WR25_17784 [Diploscapter pachys]